MYNPIDYVFYKGQAVTPPKHYGYVVAKNGVFKLVENDFFKGSVCVSSPSPSFNNGIVGLSEWTGGVCLKVPKIPYQLLYTVLNHAKKAGSGGAVLRPIEQMYHFHYIKGKWRVGVPEQVATPGNVRYKGGDANTIVLDLHSHHAMRAYFSDTDNKDELGCRFYGVVGDIYDVPEIRLRFGLYGDFEAVKATSIFEGCLINDLYGG